MKITIYKKTETQDKWAGVASQEGDYVVLRASDHTLFTILQEFYKREAFRKNMTNGTARFLPIADKAKGFFHNLQHNLPSPFYIRKDKIEEPASDDIKYTKYLETKERSSWKAGA